MPKPPIIPPTMVFTDRAGIEWTTAPNYQDRDATAPGWLALRSALGTERSFSQVVVDYGFQDKDQPYLISVVRDA